MTEAITQHKSPAILNLNTELEVSTRYVELSDSALEVKLHELASINKDKLMPHAAESVHRILGRLTFEIASRQCVAEEESEELAAIYSLS